MPRLVRTALLLLGLCVLGFLVWRIGPALIFDLLRRVGWHFLVVAALYALHLAVRGYALWRSLPRAVLSLGDVVRIRFAAESVEMLTFTGPFLAEPAKGWLLTRRGVTLAEAFGAIAIEYLVYTLVSAWLATFALWLLLSRDALPAALHGPVTAIMIAMVLFTAGFAFAAVTGIGLIVPIVRASGVVIGRRRAGAAAARLEPIEAILVAFMHRRPLRLAEVILAEAVTHSLMAAEIWVVFAALALRFSFVDPFVVEGSVKFVNVAFFFVPGQVGAQEGVYSLVLAALGLPTAVGLTVSFVRRLRALLVAGAGLLFLPADAGRRRPAHS
jgi:Lysylphosphatidylglycerol synthase TM region